MTILRDVPISLTPEEVLQAQCRNQRVPAHPALVSAAQKAVAISQVIIAPAAVCDEFPVRDVVGEQVVLSADSSSERKDKRYLTVGPRVDLLAPARLVMVAVYTIGPALEKRVSELHAAGEDLLAFMLDSVGVMALGAIGEALRDRVEKRWSSPTTLMWRTLWDLWLAAWCNNCGQPSAR